MIIAIQPDNYGPNDASAPLWRRFLEEAGHQILLVDVYRADILEQLAGCDGFMWRHGHNAAMRQIAKRLLPVLENYLGLALYPDQRTCWHYDDKLAQAYLFKAGGIPAPDTWVWFDRDAALQWAETAGYPLVLKLWAGAGSSNVKLIDSPAGAQAWIERLFGKGVASFEETLPPLAERMARSARALLGRPEAHPWELHKNYVLLQEFLPGNDFDTRITVIGNRAFAYRRYNRPNDFRASGSGCFDTDPMLTDPDALRLAFDVARRLDVQSVAFDVLKKEGRPVVGEVSYTYVSWMVEACPGHWDAELNWHEGRMWPEKAQVEDFLERLKVCSA